MGEGLLEPLTGQAGGSRDVHPRRMHAAVGGGSGLDYLRVALPGFEESAVLVKAAAIDRWVEAARATGLLEGRADVSYHR